MSEQKYGHEQNPEFTQRFIDAVTSVKEYNSKYTGTGHMASVMVSFFRFGDEPEQPEKPRVSAADKAQMEKELVALLQTDELEAMGITLFDSKAPGIKEADFSEPEEEANGPPSALVMLITDGDKFEDTLYQLNPTDEQRGQTANGVNTLLSNIVSLVQTAYAFEKPEDMSEEVATDAVKRVVDQQLDMFIDLSPALVKQGFGEVGAFNKLADYAARHSTGTLADYRGTEAQGWLAEAGYGGPSRWVRDTTAERLHERWTEAFDYLKGLRDREEPSAYFTELFNKLRADFDTSRQWLEGDESAEQRGQYSDDYIQPLKEEMATLSKVWEQDFTLENSFYLSETAEKEK